MKEISLNEHKLLELEILKNVANFCIDNNLNYFLAYGTLLGAVRHKGFIPWDDDVDIWMPRVDYQKFLDTYNLNNKTDYYTVISPYEERAKHSYLKVIDQRTVKIEKGIRYNDDYLGVDIDIFPLDGQPEKDRDFKFYYKKLYKLYKLYNNFVLSNTDIFDNSKDEILIIYLWKVLLRINHSLTRKISMLFTKKQQLLEKCENIQNKYLYDKSTYVGSISSIYSYTNDRFLKEYFNDKIEIEFEGNFYYAPAGYQEVLKLLYNEYMQLPPKEKQCTHHYNNTWWK